MSSGLGARRLSILVAVAAALLVSCTSSSGTTEAAKPKVTSFTAKAVNAEEIDLQWSASGTGIKGYKIEKYGSYLNVIEGTSFQDTSLEPETSYTYTVSIRDANGHYLPGTTATATTPAPPPLSQAHLDGSFVMKMRFTSENYSNRKVGDHFREPWEITAKCDTGPCGATLKTHRRGMRPVQLTRKGATYSGKGTDTQFSCNDVRATESYSVSVHVTAATYVDGAWTAMKLSGTVTSSSPPLNGCQAGHATLATAGTRVGG
jgi:hypothetical protein